MTALHLDDNPNMTTTTETTGKKLKAVLIDDEASATRVLTSLIETYIPDIEIIATAANVPAGVLAINRNQPDVVFLDIEMPDYSGFELLEFFRETNFEIIFTTAYSQYALKAFEVSAVDYLLKPIQIDKLEAACQKLRNKMQSNDMFDRLQTLKTNLKEDRIKRIALPVSDGLLFIDIEDIVQLDADGAYTQVWLKGGSHILVSKNLKYFEDVLLPYDIFFRPHRSHVININYLKKYSRLEGTLVMQNNHQIVLAKNRKQEFEDYVEKIRI